MAEPSTDCDVMVLPFLSSLGIKDLGKSASSLVSMSSEPEGSPLGWAIEHTMGRLKCVLDALSVSVREVWLGRSPTGWPVKAVVHIAKT